MSSGKQKVGLATENIPILIVFISVCSFQADWMVFTNGFVGGNPFNGRLFVKL